MMILILTTTSTIMLAMMIKLILISRETPHTLWTVKCSAFSPSTAKDPCTWRSEQKYRCNFIQTYFQIYGLDLFAKAAVLINAEGFVEVGSSELHLKVRNLVSAQVTEMDITAAFTEIKMHLDGLLGEGNLGETINNILNLLGPMIWDLVKEFLFPLIDDVLMKVNPCHSLSSYLQKRRIKA